MNTGKKSTAKKIEPLKAENVFSHVSSFYYFFHFLCFLHGF